MAILSRAGLQQRFARIWRPEVRYSLLVVVLIAVMGTAFERWQETAGPGMAAMTRVTASLVGALLSPFATGVDSAGSGVRFGGFGVEIIPECTGLFEIMVFSACVLAYPATWRERAWGLAFGSVVIYGLNILRIATLLVAGSHSSELFELLHVYLWQVTLVAMVASVWLIWLLLFVRR